MFTSSSSPFSSPSSPSSVEQRENQRIERIKKNFPLPTKCECCGCCKVCSPDCKRPKSFFQRQRPPFVPKGNPKWNLLTDYENEKVPIRQKALSSSSNSSSNNIPTSMKETTPSIVVLREWDHTRSSTIQIQRRKQQEVESSSSGISWIKSWWN